MTAQSVTPSKFDEMLEADGFIASDFQMAGAMADEPASISEMTWTKTTGRLAAHITVKDISAKKTETSDSELSRIYTQWRESAVIPAKGESLDFAALLVGAKRLGGRMTDDFREIRIESPHIVLQIRPAAAEPT